MHTSITTKTFFMFGALFLFGCVQQKEEKKILASVGKSKITIEDFNLLYNNKTSLYSTEEHKKIITEWINSELLYLSAVNSDLDKDESLSLKISLFRKRLLGSAFLEMYSSKKAFVSSKEIREYYNKNRDNFIRDKEEVRILHLLFKDKKSALDAKKALLSYDSSQKLTLIENYSININVVSEISVLPELKKYVFGRNKNLSLIGPIKTEYGYHVLNVLDRFPKNSYIGIDELYDEISQRIIEQKNQLLYIQLIDSLRNFYGTFINEQLLSEEL